jgi:8-oxo-dGTP pyrophosphatase MutT (NUDIX family)
MTQILSLLVQVHVYRRSPDGSYEFLLLQRADDEPVYPLLWQVVTGYRHEEENASSTARREVEEETGLREGVLHAVPHVASFYDARLDAISLVPVFAFEVPPGAAVTLSHEHREYAWLGYDDAMRRLPIPGQRDGLRILRTFILDGEAPRDMFRLD